MGILSVPGIGTTSDAFRQALWYLCNRSRLNVDAVATCISHESRFQGDAKNPQGSAIGLLQWTEVGAKASGTTVGALAKMSAIEQLPYVEAFFKATLKDHRPKNIADYLLAGWGRADLADFSDETVLAKEGELAYAHNKGLDTGHTGKITIGDLRASFWTIYQRAKGERTKETEIGMVRMNPLPPNTVLWADIIGDKREAFTGWIASLGEGVKVHHIEAVKTRVVSTDTQAWEVLAPDWMSNPTYVHRLWVLFECRAPDCWWPEGLGYPTLAPKGAATVPDDTVDKPEPPTPESIIAEALRAVGEGVAVAGKSAAKGFGLVVGSAIGLWGLTRWLSRR